MPVMFVVDPKLPKDVATITLSYTFFEVEGNELGNTKRVQSRIATSQIRNEP
jgi:cytochrome c oxidase assembly protein Cox11